MNIIVRNSRIFIAMLIAVGLLFFLVGLAMLAAWMIGGWNPVNSTGWAFWLFEIFAIGAGGMIMVSQIANFIKPFVMLTVSEAGISFGTGWRYTPYILPWSQIEGAETTSGGFRPLKVFKDTKSLVIKVKLTEGTPASMATSAGIIYGGGQLIIDGNYADRPADEVAEIINQKLKE